MGSNINLFKTDYLAFQLIPFKSIEKPFAEIYTDFSSFTVSYESVKSDYKSLVVSTYASLEKPFDKIYLDYTSLNKPYTSLDTGYTSVEY